MTNDEALATKESRNPNDKETTPCPVFGIRHWDFFRHSDLGISHFLCMCSVVQLPGLAAFNFVAIASAHWINSWRWSSVRRASGCINVYLAGGISL